MPIFNTSYNKAEEKEQKEKNSKQAILGIPVQAKREVSDQ